MPKCAENSLSGIDPLIVSLKQKVCRSLSLYMSWSSLHAGESVFVVCRTS